MAIKDLESTADEAKPMFTPEHQLKHRCSFRSKWKNRSAKEAGFVLVFCAFFMTTLIAFAGFAVDLGNWYLHANRLQRAADAAALAGTVYLPNDVPNAKSTAADELDSNQVPPDVARDITQSSAKPSQLRVKLTEEVPTFFVSALGIETVTLSRTSTAEYRPYVPMGSPSNVLGVESSLFPRWEKSSTQGLQNHYWLNVAGGSTYKSNGDRYSGAACQSGTDRCATGVPLPTGNKDYAEDGQIYVVHIPEGTTGTVRIQGFDPVFANVGDHCDTNLTGASNINALYAMGDANTACTGDQLVGATSTPTNTTFQLWTPVLGGSRAISSGACTPKTYGGYNGSILNKVDPSKPTYDANFTNNFRKWVTLCDINIGTSGSAYPPGDYLLHVTTPLGGSGMNRFALRVGAIDAGGTLNTVKSAGLSIFSQGRLVIYAHEQTGDVTFFLARINSTAASHTIAVALFDIGDAAGGANLQVLPPPDAKKGGLPMTTFSGCSYTPPGSTIYKATTTTCGINNMTSSSYNGRIINLQIPLTSDYSCNDADPNGCWTRLKLHYGDGQVADTTSWEVGLTGSPVRLIPNDDE